MNSPFRKRSHLRNQEEESRLIESPIKFTHGKSRETRRPHLLCLQHCLASFPKENKNNTLKLSTQVQYLYGQGILYILLLVLQLFSHQAIIQHLKLFVRIWNKNGLHVDLWLTSVMTHMNFLKRHLLIAFSLPPCPGVFCRNYSIGLPPFLSLCLKQNPPYPLFDSSVA